MRTRLMAGAVLVATGCTTPNDTERSPSEPRVSTAQSRSLVHEIRQQESAFERLAGLVPTSAGFFYDDAGTMTVVVVDLSEAPIAEKTALELVARRIVAAADGGFRVPHVRVVKGEYRFVELAAWRDVVTDQMLGKSGVILSDLDERSNRVTVGIDPLRFDEARDFVRARATESGIPLEALRIVAESAIHFDDDQCSPEEAGTIESRYRPLMGGLQLRWPNSSSCATLGFLATSGSSRYLVTNSHVTGTLFSIPGTPRVFYQGDSSTFRIGVEAIDPGCYTSCRRAEAALIAIDDSVTADVGTIARTTFRNSGGGYADYGSKTPDTNNPRFWIYAHAGSIASGQAVNKVGRTTGWTWGAVQQTCTDRAIDDENNVTRNLKCQFKANYRRKGGDSGSPVFYWTSGNTVVLAGIHWAGTSDNEAWFSPYTNIEDDLGTLQARYMVGSPSISGSISSNYPVISWSATSNATSYRVFRCVDEEGGPNCYMGDEDLGSTTSTSFHDITAPIVDSYYGGSSPTGPRIRYIVRAYGNDVPSDGSNIVWFSYTP